MVHLDLVSAQGNGVRYFPYTGHLGLTEVLIEGSVSTKLDEDHKLLPAKSITVSVRCYSTVLGPAGVVASQIVVDSTTDLWRASGGEYEDIGDGSYRFRIHIPPKLKTMSTAYFVQYRCVWRLEAVLSHIPIPGVGSRQVKHAQLPFLSYHSPQPLLSDVHHAFHTTAGFVYQIQSPLNSIGPSEPVKVPIIIRPPSSSPSASIRSASLQVERRLYLKSGVFAHPIVDTHLDGPFDRTESGDLVFSLAFKWPEAKSIHRWAIGETVRSELASIKFFLKIKILLSPSSESIELEEKELLITSTNEEERKNALETFKNPPPQARSKSKSPRRVKKGPSSPSGTQTLPPLPSATHSSHTQSRNHWSTVSLNGAASRRPHTSAGPRDNSLFSTSSRSPRPSPQSTPPDSDNTKHSLSSNPFRRWTSARATMKSSGAVGYLTGTPSPNPSSESTVSLIGSSSDKVKEWEEELAKIEARSRRNSVLHKRLVPNLRA